MRTALLCVCFKDRSVILIWVLQTDPMKRVEQWMNSTIAVCEVYCMPDNC